MELKFTLNNSWKYYGSGASWLMHVWNGTFKKSNLHLLQERRDIFRFMSSYKHLFPVEKMARIFRVSKSAYYKWCKHLVKKWDQVSARLLVHIKDIHGKSRQTYGSPRIIDKLTDIGDRNVIGWNVSKSMRAQDTVVPAWNAAVATRPITQALVLHSDRGIQYTCDAFTKEVSRHKQVNQSMSGKGDCWDNAVAESFFKSLKAEWVNRFTYKNHDQLALSLFDYIETFYNTKRVHSALGYLSPQQYAAELNNNPIAA